MGPCSLAQGYRAALSHRCACLGKEIVRCASGPTAICATSLLNEQVDSGVPPRPVSSLLDTPTATPTPCGPSTDYAIATATATIVPGTVDIGLHCGNCLTNVALPFPVVFYGTSFSSANVGTN